MVVKEPRDSMSFFAIEKSEWLLPRLCGPVHPLSGWVNNNKSLEKSFLMVSCGPLSLGLVLTITAGRHGNAISSVSLWTFCDSHTNISFIKLMYCGSDSWLLIKYNLLWNKWVKSDEHKLVWAITSGLSSLLSLDVAVFKNKQDWQSLLKAGMTY